MTETWWTSAETLECLNTEENSMVSRAIRMVGLFGDFFSLEDTMGPMLLEKAGEEAERIGKGGREEQTEYRTKENTVKQKQEETEEEGDDDAEVEKEKQQKEIEEEAESEDVKEEKEGQVEKEDKREENIEKERGDGEAEMEEEMMERGDESKIQGEEKREERMVESETDEGSTAEEGNERKDEDEEQVEEGIREEIHKDDSVGKWIMEGEIEDDRKKENHEVEESETVKGGSDNRGLEKKSDEEEGWLKSQMEEEEKVGKECEDEAQGEEEEEVGKEASEDERVESEIDDEDVDEEREGQDREKMEGKVEEAEVEGLEELHAKKEEEVNKEEEEEQVNGKEEETEEPSEEPEKRSDQSDFPKRSRPSSLQDPGVSESLSHDTENKAPRDLADGEKGAVTAKTHSGDIYPTSPSSDKEAFLSSTDALSQTAAAAQRVTDTNLPCADAHLNLSKQTEESAQHSVQEQGEEGGGDSGDTAPELHTELQTSLCRPEDKVALMDAPAQSSMNDGEESKNSSSSGNPSMDVTGGKVKKDSAERSPVMNGEADAADDSKKSSKYKTVSYRKIPRGNTRQRIDEFESMFNS